MIEGVRPSGGRVTGGMHFSISESGSLIYLPGLDVSSRTVSEMIISDRQGKVERLNLPPSRFGPMRACPRWKTDRFQHQRWQGRDALHVRSLRQKRDATNNVRR